MRKIYLEGIKYRFSEVFIDFWSSSNFIHTIILTFFSRKSNFFIFFHFLFYIQQIVHVYGRWYILSLLHFGWVWRFHFLAREIRFPAVVTPKVHRRWCSHSPFQWRPYLSDDMGNLEVLGGSSRRALPWSGSSILLWQICEHACSRKAKVCAWVPYRGWVRGVLRRWE